MKELLRADYRGFAVSVFRRWPRSCSEPLSYGYHVEDQLEVWGYGLSNTKAACRAAGKVIDGKHVPIGRWIKKRKGPVL